MASPSSTSVWLIAVSLTSVIFGGLVFASKWIAEKEVKKEEEDVAATAEPEISAGFMMEKPLPAGNENPKAPVWSYSGSSGPEHWGDLSESYAPCKQGKFQSPINLASAKLSSKLLPIRFHYRDSEGNLKNEGQRFVLNVEAGNYIEIEGDRLDLKEILFHSPSEHKVDGIPYDMELQFIHKASTGETAILGLLAEEGSSHTVLAALWNDMPRVAGDIGPMITFNPMRFVPRIQTYYSYTGSITTPPCTDGVRWLVFTQSTEVSSAQVDRFLSVMRYNARPTQALNGRTLLRSRR